MAERWVMQFCHSYYGPFLDVARQYSVLFKGTDTKVLTVFLTGADTPAVRVGCASDEVIFLGYESAEVRGAKWNAIRRVRALLKERNVTLIVAHRFKPVYIACLASKLPVIGVHHAFGDYSRWHRKLFVTAFGRRLRLLAVSNAVRDDIRRDLPRFPAGQVETLYNRVDVTKVRTDLMEQASARQALGIAADAYVFGNVGRLHADKDQATLIRAFARVVPRLPGNSILAIIGTGPLEMEMKALAADLGVVDRVLFLGAVPEARRYFRAFNAFVLSSDHEPFGMVLLEAMAADLPIICTECGGAMEVVDSAADFFPLGDETRLSDLLVEHATGKKPARQDWTQVLMDRFSDQSARQSFHELCGRLLPQH